MLAASFILDTLTAWPRSISVHISQSASQLPSNRTLFTTRSNTSQTNRSHGSPRTGTHHNSPHHPQPDTDASSGPAQQPAQACSTEAHQCLCHQHLRSPHDCRASCSWRERLVLNPACCARCVVSGGCVASVWCGCVPVGKSTSQSHTCLLLLLFKHTAVEEVQLGAAAAAPVGDNWVPVCRPEDLPKGECLFVWLAQHTPASQQQQWLLSSPAIAFAPARNSTLTHTRCYHSQTRCAQGV